MQFARHRKPGSSRHDHEGGNRKNKHSNFNQRGQWMDELMEKAIYFVSMDASNLGLTRTDSRMEIFKCKGSIAASSKLIFIVSTL